MTAFFMAWMMFFYIPCPVCRWDDSKKQDMLVCFPLIGSLIGLCDYLVYILMSYLNLRFLGSALMAFLPWMLCGFIHIDGFMDCADAVMSCRDQKRRLEILKDSHVGAFAVISVLILGMLSFASWMEVFSKLNPLVLIFIPFTSRAVAGLCVLSYKPLETSSYVSIHNEGIKKGKIVWMVVEIILSFALSFAFLGIHGISILVCAIAGYISVLVLRKNLGGMSGDISGSAICIAELMGVISLCFLL